MPKPIARYAVSFGLAGCYMPDSVYGPYIVTRRKDLAAMIREELALHELPQRLAYEVKVRDLWRHIKRHGSSSAHFTIYHKGHALQFVGLTEGEAERMDRENDFA